MQTSNGIVARFWKGRDGPAFLDPLTEGSEGAVSDGCLSPITALLSCLRWFNYRFGKTDRQKLSLKTAIL